MQNLDYHNCPASGTRSDCPMGQPLPHGGVLRYNVKVRSRTRTGESPSVTRDSRKVFLSAIQEIHSDRRKAN